jgi:colanic acid/amylovoran biosynthesis glycosyltransferase
MRIGYLVPEFPSQTHIFFWREIQALRSLGEDIVLLSTRRTPSQACRHEFASSARAETRYLFPPYVSNLRRWVFEGSPGLSAALAYRNQMKTAGAKDRVRQSILLLCAIDLVMWAREHRIDHIHGHSCADAAHILALAKRAGGPPYSLTLHGDLDVYGTDHKLKMAEAAFICTVGDHLRQQVLEQADVPSNRVLVTCMGVDMARLKPLGGERMYHAGSLDLVTVARLDPMKGHLHAISAVRRAVDLGLNVRYTIAGAGPFRDVIVSRIHELGLDQNISLTGTLSENEVFSLLSQADAFVLPSTGSGEAWPVSVMEAMGAGLPVIASIIGATPQMIAPAVDGFLVPQKDEGALFDRITLLARDIDTRQRIGQAARLTAARCFDVATTATRLRDAIQTSHNSTI